MKFYNYHEFINVCSGQKFTVLESAQANKWNKNLHNRLSCTGWPVTSYKKVGQN